MEKNRTNKNLSEDREDWFITFVKDEGETSDLWIKMKIQANKKWFISLYSTARMSFFSLTVFCD